MFAALRAVRTQTAETADASHSTSVEVSDQARTHAALVASRQLTRARRDALLATVHNHNNNNNADASDSAALASVRQLMAITLGRVPCLLGGAVQPPSSESRGPEAHLGAWTQLAVSAMLASRLEEIVQVEKTGPQPRMEAGVVQAAQARLHHCSGPTPLFSRLSPSDTAIVDGPRARHGSETAVARLVAAATVLGAQALSCRTSQGHDGVAPASVRSASANVPSTASANVPSTASARPMAKRTRSDGDGDGTVEDAQPVVVVAEGMPASVPPPAVTSITRPFSFRVRVGDVSSVAQQPSPPPPPPAAQDLRAVAQGLAEGTTSAKCGQPEAARHLFQTTLSAFVADEPAPKSTASHNNNNSTRSMGPSAAAAAVLRELRSHAPHPAVASVSPVAAPYGYPSPPPPQASAGTAAPWMSRRDDPAPPLPPPSSSYFPSYTTTATAAISRKAPPYTAGSGEAPASARPPSAAAPASGFVTAGEQLDSDIRSGRANPASASLLSRRSPALGLRRTGFQPPFQPQQPQPQQPSSSSAGDAAEASLSVNKVLKAVAAPKQSNHSSGGGDDDDEAGSYPASLLLPDGSVPAILQPLDPKLVTQVAMEILEDGAGAKKVGWEDIAGLQHAKGSVEEAIVWPLRRPDLFVGLRDPPRGLLLFGPPGTGKTMIARAIANRTECTFLNISSSSLMSKWVGDGEKLVRCLFAVATVKQPSVIFIDEIDSLLSMRGEGEMDAVRRVKTEFLVQLDGVATDRGDRVLLIGATNRPDELDEAARRRMEKRLYIPLPDRDARRELINRLLFTLEKGVKAEVAARAGGLQHAATEADVENEDEDGEGTGNGTTTRSPRSRSVKKKNNKSPPSAGSTSSPERKVHVLREADLDHLAEVTHGYSGADLKQLCREASMGPLREMSMHQLSEVAVSDLRPIDRRDFRHALRRLKPSVGAGEVVRYEEWNKQYGSFADKSDDEEDDMTDSDASPTK